MVNCYKFLYKHEKYKTLPLLLFYILTLWLVASTKLAWSAGREVVEKKMVERLRD